jgi:hypothetical protein
VGRAVHNRRALPRGRVYGVMQLAVPGPPWEQLSQLGRLRGQAEVVQPVGVDVQRGPVPVAPEARNEQGELRQRAELFLDEPDGRLPPGIGQGRGGEDNGLRPIVAGVVGGRGRKQT